MNTPERIGPYEIVRLLGRGGMAEVSLGRLRGADGFERDVAIKRVLPGYASDRAFLEMFRREASIMAELRHGNIVQVIELRQDAGELWLVMEYVDGASLATVLNRATEMARPIPPTVIAYVLIEVARALDYAHRKQGRDGARMGIIHRDVSASNVLVSRDGEVRLADFGIASAASNATVSGLSGIKGKISYMAPERLSAGEVDGRSDIYSLGVLGWEMVVGELPYDAETLEAKMMRIMTTPAPLVATRAPSVPPLLGDMIDRMMERLATRRPGRALEVADALAPLLATALRRPEEELARLVGLVAHGGNTLASTAATAVQGSRGQGVASGRVLVVERSKTARALVRSALGGQALEIVEVDDALAALEALMQGEFALVISQHALSGDMDGIALCEAVRRRSSTLPFVLMVSGAPDEQALKADAAGVTSVVSKADPSALVARIRELARA
jgi:CheY-like chemotaxis protein